MIRTITRHHIVLAAILATKGAAIFAALVFSMMLLNNLHALVPKLANMQKYAELKQYVGISISPEVDMSPEFQHKLDEDIADFFALTNSDMGFLFSLSSQLDSFNHPERSFVTENQLKITDYVAYVNNNYLRKNPIYDLNGNAVQVDEALMELTFFVPEKFKELTAVLTSELADEITTLYYYADDVAAYGVEKAEGMVHERLPVNIVYIKDGQKAFMYNFTKQRHINEYIEDAIIHVVTTGNAPTSQLPHYLTTQKYMLCASDTGAIDKIYEQLDKSGLMPSLLSVSNKYDRIAMQLSARIKAILIQALFIMLGCTLSCLCSKLFYKYCTSKKPTLFIVFISAACVALLWQKVSFFLLLTLFCIYSLMEYVISFYHLSRCGMTKNITKDFKK